MTDLTVIFRYRLMDNVFDYCNYLCLIGILVCLFKLNDICIHINISVIVHTSLYSECSHSINSNHCILSNCIHFIEYNNYTSENFIDCSLNCYLNVYKHYFILYMYICYSPPALYSSMNCQVKLHVVQDNLSTLYLCMIVIKLSNFILIILYYFNNCVINVKHCYSLTLTKHLNANKIYMLNEICHGIE